jgi:CDP-diacylglycerol--glycerol-3-phosphate 3-phosphatidyltransferase (EC 2.7.8.5)
MIIDFLKKSFDKLPIEQGRKEIFNLPNSITLLRICVIPVLFLILLSPGRTLSLLIAIVFIIAALTDLLDGYIARRYGMVTKIGKFLDPIADKIIVSTAMILMIPIGRIPAWIVAVIIIRDITVNGVRSISSSDDSVVSASKLGKQKTLSQNIALSALIIHYPLFGIDARLVGIIILYIALFLTVWSGVDYILKFCRGIKQ